MILIWTHCDLIMPYGTRHPDQHLIQLMSLYRHRAIAWSNAELSSIRPQGTYFNYILFHIQKFPFKKMHLEMS